jgi:transposase
MENASRAFLDAVRKSMRQIRIVIGATTIDPKLLTAAEHLQYEGYLRREETNAAILALSKNGIPIKQIVRQTGHSRKLVRQVVRGERHDVFRTRQSSLDLHLPWLDDQWASGCRNGAELWRRLTACGFRGSLRVISEWATRRRRAERTDPQTLQRIPLAIRKHWTPIDFVPKPDDYGCVWGFWGVAQRQTQSIDTRLAIELRV